MQYQVGQILFVVFKDKQSLVPVRVVEEVVRRTSSGEQRSYFVSVSDTRDNLKAVPLEEPAENVFASLDDAKDALLQNARLGIEKVCERARLVKEKEFPGAQPTRNMLEQSFEESDSEGVQDDATILLDNGVRAKIRLPPELS
jgi:hypothetical protein